MSHASQASDLDKPLRARRCALAVVAAVAGVRFKSIQRELFLGVCYRNSALKKQRSLKPETRAAISSSEPFSVLCRALFAQAVSPSSLAASNPTPLDLHPPRLLLVRRLLFQLPFFHQQTRAKTRTNMQLSSKTLSSLPPTVAVPRYDRSAVTAGIVHFGAQGALLLPRVLISSCFRCWSLSSIAPGDVPRPADECGPRYGLG